MIDLLTSNVKVKLVVKFNFFLSSIVRNKKNPWFFRSRDDRKRVRAKSKSPPSQPSIPEKEPSAIAVKEETLDKVSSSTFDILSDIFQV